jgi:tol-pal system protein YbgF
MAILRHIKGWWWRGIGVGMLSVSLAHAAAPVEDRGAGQAASPRVADLFYQVQRLQQEVMELRGQLEEQGYRLRRLEQQRLEDYESLDKRLREGGARSSSVTKPSSRAKTSAEVATSAAAQAKIASVSSASTSGANNERNAYQRAFQQLKKQQLDEAERSFEDFIRDYPDGQYTSNAYYWLGELYLTKENLPKARATFSTMIERYPDFRKTPDSSYKLAKIYDEMGDEQKSKALLQKIVTEYGQTSPATVAQASAYLDKHFR